MDSILIKKKKELHEKIGYAIEELYNENIDQYYGMLTKHFQAGEAPKWLEEATEQYTQSMIELYRANSNADRLLHVPST